MLTRTVCTRCGTPVGVVLDRDLALAVGPEERQRAVAAHLGQAARDAVRERDRQRHQLIRLVGREAEHHSLVAGAELVGLPSLARLERVVDALRDVGRLLLDGRQGPAGLPVEAEPAVGVADVAHRAAHDVLDVDVVGGRHLAEHEDHAGGRRHLDRAARVGIVRQDVVEHGVGDGVAQLVGMTLGHRLRCEEGRHLAGDADQVPDSHDSRRSSAPGSSARCAMPMVSSLRRAISRSMSSGMP